MVRDAKRLYFNEVFINANGNSRIIWKTIKSFTGMGKNKQVINKLKDGDYILEDGDYIS